MGIVGLYELEHHPYLSLSYNDPVCQLITTTGRKVTSIGRDRSYICRPDQLQRILYTHP